MKLNREFITTVIPQVQFVGPLLPDYRCWSIDSRTLQPGQLFVALRGSRVDGHTFVTDAFARGAAGVLIAASHVASLRPVIDRYITEKTFIIVDDPYEAICALATAWRQQFSYPVVGITGSVGKTTTKEIIGAILRAQGKCAFLSQGNQNTRLGISLNMFGLESKCEVAVFEMGVSKRGEMVRLAELVRPTIAVITAIGHSHMEGLGSLVDIAAEKRDIFHYLKDDGIGIIDGDQPLLSAVSYRHPVIKFGRKMINQVQARKIQCNSQGVQFQLKLYQERCAVAIPSENAARIHNILAATAVAYTLGVPVEIMSKAVQEPLAVHGRFKKYSIAGTESVVIDDSYNANPESMKAALQAFNHMEGQRKVAVLGDMLELGVNSPFWHRQLGRFLRKVSSLQEVIFVGEQVKWAHKVVPLGIKVHYVATWQDAVPLVQEQLATPTLVLVKASRGIALNKLVEVLLTAKS